MKRLKLVLFLSLATLITAAWENSSQRSDAAFRTRMVNLVEEGSRYYYLSNRQGIMSIVDSIESALSERSNAGRLSSGDSLEFTAHRLRLQGDWYYENGNYDSRSFVQAEDCFKEALEIFSSGFFAHDYDLFRRPPLCRELAQLYYRLERYGEALLYTDMALDAYQDAYLNQKFFEGYPEWEQWHAVRMQKALCLARLGRFDEALQIVSEVFSEAVSENDDVRYGILRMKGKILLLKGDEASRKEAAVIYNDYLKWRKADALDTMVSMSPSERMDYWMQMRPFVTDAYLLEAEDPALLYDIALYSKNLLLQMNLMTNGEFVDTYLNHSWKDIEKSLPKGGAAIEFVQYEGKMAAIVVRKGAQPVWVQLPSAREVLDYEIYGNPIRNRLTSTSGQYKNAIYEDAGLARMIWNRQLLDAIGGSSSVYFAPDGYLHQLAIEYMLPPCMNGKDIYRLTSTRQLLAPRLVSTASSLIVGGVDYNAELPPEGEGANDESAFSLFHNTSVKFGALKGSLSEAEAIYNVRANPADTLLTGKNASEHNFRGLAGNYAMLCIATHGYFRAAETPVGTDVKVCMSDDALSESLLALAGANTSIHSDSFNPSMLDGLLSAAEICRMDLSNVDIAVVSACQAGLGYVTSDGVYGIQRGFKNAGAGCLVVSLWNVDDSATYMLMTSFQQNLSKGMTTHAAFNAARKSLPGKQRVMKKRFNPATMSEYLVYEETDYHEPRYTNAFLLIDAIE